MKKKSVVIVLLAGFLTLISFRATMGARAEDNVATLENQVINDEGYGNDDAEYYNSEDDRVNDEEVSENSLNNAQP